MSTDVSDFRICLLFQGSSMTSHAGKRSHLSAPTPFSELAAHLCNLMHDWLKELNIKHFIQFNGKIRTTIYPVNKKILLFIHDLVVVISLKKQAIISMCPLYLLGSVNDPSLWCSAKPIKAAHNEISGSLSAALLSFCQSCIWIHWIPTLAFPL